MSLVIAIIYFAILIIGAGLLTRKRIKSAKEFGNAGKSLGWVLVAFSFVLVPLGSGHTMSLWEQTAGGMGASTLWWALGAGGIFLPIMMLWLAPVVRNSGCDTMPQISTKLFGRGMGWLHDCVTIGAMTGLCSAEIIATGAAIYALSNGAIPLYPTCILISFAFIVLYVIFGGVLQMAWVNIINSIVMILGSYIALFMIVAWLNNNFAFSGTNGLQAVWEYFASSGNAAKLTQFEMANPNLWLGTIIPVILLHLCAAGVFQPHNITFFAAKSDQACRKGVFLGTFINIMSSVPWVAIALIGLALPAVVAAGGAELPKLIVPLTALHTLPQPIVGMLMISLLAATLSTGGSLVIGNGQVLATDIIKGALFPKMKEKTHMIVTRVCVILCGVICLVPALNLPVIMPVFFWCFTFSMPLFVNYLMGMHVRCNKLASWINVIIAYIVAFIWTFIPLNVPAPFNMAMYPVLLVSIVLGVVLPFVLPGSTSGKYKAMKESTISLEVSK